MVTLAPTSPGGAAYTIEGTIVDYRGDAITIQRPRGSEKTYPSERVMAIQTEWPPAYLSAKQSMTQRAWAAAAAELDTAVREESRRWARRRVLTDLMRCQMAMGRWEQAGELFSLVVRSDPRSEAWGEAPLPWFAAGYVPARTAAKWLEAGSPPPLRLLGAGWLLTTAQKPEAVAVLRELAASDSPEIATLAASQQWRAELTGVTDRQAGAWRLRVEAMPRHLQAGPRHVLAQAYYRLARYDAAALAALESPLTGAVPRELAARALVLAGRAAWKSGHRDEARLLWAEVRDDYADTPQRVDAAALLPTLDSQ